MDLGALDRNIIVEICKHCGYKCLPWQTGNYYKFAEPGYRTCGIICPKCSTLDSFDSIENEKLAKKMRNDDKVEYSKAEQIFEELLNTDPRTLYDTDRDLWKYAFMTGFRWNEGWISVEKELPKETTPLTPVEFVFNDNDTQSLHIGTYSVNREIDEKNWYSYLEAGWLENHDERRVVTHWRHIVFPNDNAPII